MTTHDITNTPAIHVHGGLEYHVDETGWCKVYDPENPGVWHSKGPAEELLPASLLREASIPCTHCGSPIFDVEMGFFCSDECREEAVDSLEPRF
jgi:hypothetical protein